MRSKTTFLNFYKLILEKVKFSPELFWKEYQKAVQYLTENERNELNSWILKTGVKRKVSLK